MIYKYRNLKHITLHGMPPYGTGEFDHKIEGGGIELIEEFDKKTEKNNNKNEAFTKAKGE